MCRSRLRDKHCVTIELNVNIIAGHIHGDVLILAAEDYSYCDFMRLPASLFCKFLCCNVDVLLADCVKSHYYICHFKHCALLVL